jgi:RNA polymerase sigma-70 factor (ECF subfamily)
MHGEARQNEFEALIRDHGTRLLATARRILNGDEEEARDALQDALLAAHRSLGEFRADAQMSTWLYRIVTNAALMRLRAGRVRRETPVETLPVVFDAPERPFSVAGWPADALLERQSLRARVRACIDRLPARQRDIIMLRDIEELSTRETALRLSITPCAVKLRLMRARRALMALLATGDDRAATPAAARLRAAA